MLGRRGEGEPDPADTYADLRELALTRTSALVSAEGTGHPGVLGAVVDIASGDGGVSVVALSDGTTSMYTSTGGGIIGAGSHESVAAATDALLRQLESMLAMFPADDRMDLPSPEMVQVTVLTPAGRRRASIPEAAFWGREPSGVIPLIAAIHEVIAALREVDADV